MGILSFGRKAANLDDVMIAAPCPAKWEEMQGDDVKRFCGKCALNVYNTSELTGQEIMDLMEQSEGRTCLRLYRRQDGTLITKDCPVGTTMRERIERARRRMQTAAALILAFLHVPGAMAQNRQTDNKAGAGNVLQPMAGAPMPIKQSQSTTPQPTLGEPMPGQALMGRAPVIKKDVVSEHADTLALESYNQARAKQSAGQLEDASKSYECALKTIDQAKTKHDVKFGERIAGDYCKLLKQMGNKKRAAEVAEKYKVK